MSAPTLPPDSTHTPASGDYSYLQHRIPVEALPNLGDKWLFVGIDLAPIDSLETGIAVIDRNRRLMRMDKLSTDADVLRMLESLGPRSGLIICLDLPKSLSLESKWRQQEIKMHPLRLNTVHREETVDRIAPRAWALYAEMVRRGYLVLNYFTPHAKLRYHMLVPYKSRTPQGCKALQAAIRQQMSIQDLPVNLAPSSVLDAMIGAYLAWSLFKGKDGEHFELYRNDQDQRFVDPLAVIQPKRRKPRRRRMEA
ncbi:MAG: hypothetical protein AB7P76_03305 [Candidatus Melainabacteria bacterium]